MKRFSYLYEIPIFFLLLHAFNAVFIAEDPGYVYVNPHPYWAGVLIFGFRYGTVAGFLSGVYAAAQFLAVVFFLGPDRGEFDKIPFYGQPSLFILIGTLIGAGIHRYRSDIRRHLKDKSEHSTREKSLREEIKTLTDLIAELEKRIVTRMSTLITLYEGARKLETVHIEELYKAILDFMARTLESERAALYLKDDNRLLLKESWGYGSDESPPAEIFAGAGVAGYAFLHGKVTTVRDFLSEQDVRNSTPIDGDCLMAAPLRLGEQGDVCGVITIQRMPFLSFNSAAINLLSFLIGWANRSLGRAAYIQNLKAHEIIDPEFGIYSHSYLKSRSDEEFMRSRTYYLPLSFALVRVEGLDLLSDSKRAGVLAAVSQLLKESCRNMDIVARFPDKSAPFAVLMVTTSQAQAEEMRKKILERFANLGLQPQVGLAIGLASFSPQTKAFQELIDAARQEVLHGSESAA